MNNNINLQAQREKMLDMTSDLNMLVANYSKEKEANTVLLGQIKALEKEMRFIKAFCFGKGLCLLSTMIQTGWP